VLEEAQHCTLVTVVYRDGTPRLWALKLPRITGGITKRGQRLAPLLELR
jgi:hypothetical protein